MAAILPPNKRDCPEQGWLLDVRSGTHSAFDYFEGDAAFGPLPLPSFPPPMSPNSAPEEDGSGKPAKGQVEDRPYAEIRPFIPASWFHEQGIYKVLRRLEPRLPDVGGKLFLTFTTDPKLFKDAESGFECGRERLRKVFYRLRKGVEWESEKFQIDAPYCVKVEFHENGWAHFHAIFLTRRFLPGGLLNELWGHGRTNVERISQEKFRYLLKYVTKGDSLPDWILNRPRLRVFQTSRGFLKPVEGKRRLKSKVTKSEDEPEKPGKSACIGERLEKWRNTGILRELDRHRPILFERPYSEVVAGDVLDAAKAGSYRGRQVIEFRDQWDIEAFLEDNK